MREAIFSILTSLGAIEGATVVDLFAGSGALGIEALSRGATSCTFVDRDRRAVAAIRANVAATGLEAAATVIHHDVLRWLATVSPPAFTLALIDPPYDFDRWPKLLERLRADLVVMESDRTVTPGKSWQVLAQRRYGDTVMTFASSEASPPTIPEHERQWWR